MNHKFLSFGERAILVELENLDAAIAATAALQAGLGQPLEASKGGLPIIQLVPGARTVLIEFDANRLTSAKVREWATGILETAEPAVPATNQPAVELEIRYDGPDLEALAKLLGCSTEALIAQHLASDWRVAFAGFTPGFAYLVASDWPHIVPRHESPRTRVEPGSVGLASEFCGIYPRSTPGGWQLIGTSDAVLFDVNREPAALLTPATRVKFRRMP